MEDDLATGRLVAPFDLRVPTKRAYFLATHPYREKPERLAALRGLDPVRSGDRRGQIGRAGGVTAVSSKLRVIRHPIPIDNRGADSFPFFGG